MPEITVIPARNDACGVVRVAAYCRVSCGSDDQLNSFTAQIRHYTELFQNSTDTVLVDVYADEGITGTCVEKRDEFNRILRDCKKRKIDRILTKSISRFARNTKGCLEAVRELKSLGVSVYLEKEKIDTEKINDELFLTINSMFAQEESISISKNVRLRVRKRMADGTYINPSVPYGYIYDDGKVLIDEPKAEIVRLIFASFLNGKGVHDIAAMLDSTGVEHPLNAESWNLLTIHNILTNERYVGNAVLQKSFTTESLPFKMAINRGEMPKYHVRNTNPPIIDSDTIINAQSLLTNKSLKYSERKPKGEYSLNKKIKCMCGRHIAENK